MPFTNIECTESLFENLALPDWLRKSEDKNPIGRALLHDLALKAALIPHPFSHSTYPDQAFTLIVSGRCMNVWCEVTNPDKKRISIWITEDTEDLTDQFLMKLLQSAFSAFNPAQEPVHPIVINGRSRLQQSTQSSESKISTLKEWFARVIGKRT